MSRSFLSAFRNSMIEYAIERNENIVNTFKGLPNHEKSTGLAYVGFEPGTDVKTGDWMINPLNERFYVRDAKTAFFQGQPHSLNAYYLTESEYKDQQTTASNIFNIGTAYGSVIGTQTSVTLNYNESIENFRKQVNEQEDSPDKEQMNQIISLLEMITKDQLPVQKGLFSRFSALMEKHTWISNAVSSTILSWLTTRL
ncbi:MAG TPA: hypothetical protein DDY31_14830 [Lachnospiraceae bacterium]|nr:hypothetical protein [Lachnospiraceae bacterium]